MIGKILMETFKLMSEEDCHKARSPNERTLSVINIRLRCTHLNTPARLSSL